MAVPFFSEEYQCIFDILPKNVYNILRNIDYCTYELIWSACERSGTEISMLSCKEIAEKWGVSVRAVSGMCSSGRIEGL